MVFISTDRRNNSSFAGNLFSWRYSKACSLLPAFAQARAKSKCLGAWSNSKTDDTVY